MFNDINYAATDAPVDLPLDLKTHQKSTKSAIIVLSVLSALMLIAIVIIIVLEVTKNNKSTPDGVDSFAVVIVDDGNDRVGVMTQLVKRYFQFEFEVVVALTAHGVTMSAQIDNATLVNVNTAKNPLDVFLYFLREGVPENITNWIFLGDNVVPQQNVYTGDFFINQLFKFVNLVQVDDVLFSMDEIPPSAPTMAMPNTALPFVKSLLDLKLYMGISTEFIYSPSNNQVIVLIDNDDLNERTVSTDIISSERFVSYFIGNSVPKNSNKYQQLEQRIRELMLTKLT